MRRSGGNNSARPVLAIDRGRNLSAGALVQASVRARLLGIPLLRLDATVALVPAALGNSSFAATGNGLADAVRRINEGEAVLAQVRRDTAALPIRRG